MKLKLMKPLNFCRLGINIYFLHENSILKYSAKYDSLALGVTIMVIALLTMISILIFTSPIILLIKIITVIALALLVFSIYLFSPKEYVLSANGILIKRFIKSINIPYSLISDIKYDPNVWRWLHLRLFGSGGLFGWWGLFSLKNIGRAWLYVTNRRNLVVIRLKNGRVYVLSPENPLDFINNIQIKMLNR